MTRGQNGPVLQPVECDPAIATLRGVSTMPLPGQAGAPAASPW